MSTLWRLLVVDDDPKVRLLLERAFRAPEFETHAFATGAAALEHVEAVRPDCVVSDLLMPDMDGETLLRAIRERPGLRGLPFVVVSAVRSESRIRAVLDAGANAFLLKPFPLRDLLERIRSLLAPVRPPEPGPPNSSEETMRLGDRGSATGPLYAAAHTVSTIAAPRRSGPGAAAAPLVARLEEAQPTTRISLSAERTAGPATASAPTERRTVELRPPDRVGFGRYTRVETGGRSFVVLTEAVAQPRFVLTTVVTEGGVPLRKIESSLPHPLAREDDGAMVRSQLDLQHEGVLEGLDRLVIERTGRRVVWSDQSRTVDAGLLAWAMSAVAQLVETETGTDETMRQLRMTRERIGIEGGDLRSFHVTPLGRVVVDAQATARLPRRAVRAVATWCREFAVAALQVEADRIEEPVRQATRRQTAQLERLGFYQLLLQKAGA